MTTTNEEKAATKELVEMCRVYLRDNFHKFNEANKIKIAMALVQKAMPTQTTLDGNINVTMMGDVKLGTKALDIDIG